MIHLPELIQDLGIILITAAFVTLIFRRLKQPVVLGYLIAGILVGPHVPFLPSVTETESVKVWAEIGVIFLLFGLGLEFSFKKLAKVGKSASITALVEIISMLGIGYLVGQMLGWSKMDSIFLGGILSISSTTIIVRAFEELQLKGRNFVSLVFGVLIVEDLVAILLLVLLSSVAVTQTFAGGELVYSSLRLGFFLILWFILGIYLLPLLLHRIRDYLSDETMLIVSIGLCLMMVMVATKAGFSPALGAFVMGSLLAETREGHRIEKLMMPVRDLFGAVFFISVGMLIDPKILGEYYGVILLMTAVTIGGKLISTTLGALISGRSLKNSVQAGMSLAQIGEFSFIIATLGVTLNVTSSFLYPIAVAVSALTTFATPYLIKCADPFYFWIDRRLPMALKIRLDRYEQGMSTNTGDSALVLIGREYGPKVGFNAVFVVALTLVMSQFSHLLENGVGPEATDTVACILTLLFSAPFLWAIVAAPARQGQFYKPETINQLRKLQFGISSIRFVIGVVLVLFIVSQFVSVSAVIGIFLVVISLLGIYFSRFAEPFYQSIEKRFIANLTEKERDELSRTSQRPELAPWNASLAEFIVSPFSTLVAKSLQDLGVKEKFGVTIAMIERGGHRILAPQRTDMLLPFDKIYVIGTDEQLAPLKQIVEPEVDAEKEGSNESFGLGSVVLNEKNSFVNHTIRECGLRETAHGLIVGVERNGQRILNPDSAMKLLTGDLIWIVGDMDRIKSLKMAAQDPG